MNGREKRIAWIKANRVHAALGIIAILSVSIRVFLILFKPPVLTEIDAQRQTALVRDTGISATTIELARRGDLLQSDDAIYHLLGKNMAAGNGVSESRTEPFSPSRIRTPGYPFLLAIVYAVAGPEFKAVLVVQCLLGGLSCLLVFGIGNRLGGPRTGLLAAGIVALYPALIYYDTRLLRESLIGFLLTFTVWWNLRASALKPLSLVVTGVCLTWLSMCKPEMIVLSLPIYMLHVSRNDLLRSRVRTALLIVLPILMVWVPWTARNWVHFGSPSPVTLGLGSVVWFGNRWAEIGGEDRERPDQWRLRAEARGIIADANSESETKAETEFASRARNDVLTRPVWFVRMTVRKAYLFWKDANGIKKTLPALHPVLPILVNGSYYVLLALGLVGMFETCRRSHAARNVLFVILTFAGTYALLHVRNRYRVPVLPLVFVFSSVGLWSIWSRLADQLWSTPTEPNRTSSSDGGASPELERSTSKTQQIPLPQ